MHNVICDLLGMEFPLVAFSHCRDVVAAVTNAGGFGVLGAAAFSPEQLDIELTWIDEHTAGRPYGADILVPGTLVGKGEGLSATDMAARIPATHLEFIERLLVDHGVAVDRSLAVGSGAASFGSPEANDSLMDVAFAHPIKLIANALGVPPAPMILRAHREGVPVAALVGAKEHAVRQVNAGVDLLVAQGGEAGGHCGEVTTMVLVPEVIDAIAPLRPVPVLAAGGIVTGRQMAAAMALGADGVWTGSVWLTTEEAETAPATKAKMVAASSRDTVRSRSRTGKPARQLRSDWTDAWEGSDSPGALPMPLQLMISEPALRRVDQAASGGSAGATELATYFVGQGVGLMNSVRPAARVVIDIMEEFAESLARLEELGR
ncbi:MAG: nitronate monooxygenase family protein [Actinomycetota bacterium]|nr:nitronate monooxygenase family protein [Actinomycetota bacterium]